MVTTGERFLPGQNNSQSEGRKPLASEAETAKEAAGVGKQRRGRKVPRFRFPQGVANALIAAGSEEEERQNSVPKGMLFCWSEENEIPGGMAQTAKNRNGTRFSSGSAREKRCP